MTAVTKDEAAWALFVYTVQSANIPNVTAANFETWATDADVFSARPQWPPLPDSGKRQPLVKRLQPSALRLALTGTHGLRTSGTGSSIPTACQTPPVPAAADFPGTGCIAEEVRRNRPSFDYIVSTGMNTQTGMAALYKAGTKVNFPVSAIEVKADWVPVADIVKWIPSMTSTALVEANYYTNYSTDSTGKTTEYALAGYHISSKLLPNWLWVTFEHQLNPGRCDTMGCTDAYGAQQASVAPNRQASNTTYPACAKTSALLTAMGAAKLEPQWQNYCLKTTQIEFVDASGNALLDGNSLTERTNAGVAMEQASCITCHAYASYTASGAPNFAGLANNNIGNVDNALLANSKTSDFIWGILLAPVGTSKKLSPAKKTD